ncbi:MAG: DNA topoisomerase IV subunit A, partial [archaeon]|nr:DNA topoisomerase IV subunit A [archaeon]
MSSKSSKEGIASARKREVKKFLKELGIRTYSDMNKGIFPEINFPSMSVRNIIYDEMLKQYILGRTSVKRSTHNIKHIRPFTQLIWLAFFANKLVEQGK